MQTVTLIESFLMPETPTDTSPMQVLPNHLVLYDGTCGFCQHAVQVILKHDRKEEICFASLQGKTAEQVRTMFPDHDWSIDSVRYVVRGLQIHAEAEAAGRLARILHGWVKVGIIFAWLPKSVSNALYRFIARNRHRLPGMKGEVCQLPTPSERSRFLS